MPLLESKNLGPSFSAPDFTLLSVDGVRYRLADFKKSKILVVMFICSHCPYVRAVEDRLIALSREFNSNDVQFVGICSNDSTDYPDDAPANLLKRWREKEYGFPYLVDETQDVAKSYGAVCTPDLYVFDSNRKLAYHGRLDDHWQDAQGVRKRDLAEAVMALISGRPVTQPQLPSMGCSIKWKKH